MIIKVSDIPQPTLFAAGRFFQLKKVKGAQVKGAGNSIKYKKTHTYITFLEGVHGQKIVAMT